MLTLFACPYLSPPHPAPPHRLGFFLPSPTLRQAREECARRGSKMTHPIEIEKIGNWVDMDMIRLDRT